LQISTDGSQLLTKGRLPLPKEPIEKESLYPFRYALNENTDGYSSPYWDWPRWEREIDVMAVNGINAILIERGTDLVLYETFRDFGFSDKEIRKWITLPAHQNWQLLGNMCCFSGPISKSLLEKRAKSAQQMIARLRELGIAPVLPGYYGIVPAGLIAKFPKAHIVPQGDWVGFERPAWLDPRDPLFAKIAASYYRHQKELFGDTNIYDMNVFQEGGDAGNVPVKEAVQQIQGELLKAHPDAYWMMLAWQKNPTQELLQGANRDRLLIMDIEQARMPRDHRDKDFMGAPFLFGGLWNFGARNTFGANMYDYGVRIPLVGKTSSNKAGTAIFCEGMDNNPYAFDLFTEMAWRSQSVDLPQWTEEYATRRYGAKDSHAIRAWQILLRTAYGNRGDGVDAHGERDAPQESLFNALPDLSAVRASSWSPNMIRYNPAEFAQALVELLQVAPELRVSETYRYDVVDVARQVLANESRILLPQIKNAYEKKDVNSFDRLTKQWIHLMQLQDQLLSTNKYFLLGTWLKYLPSWANSPEEQARLSYDARSILTTWGDRKASESGLHDYANKDWAGLTADYYQKRWQLYFDALGEALQTNTEPKKLDWFALGDEWNREDNHYSSEEKGDSYVQASRVAQELHLSDRQ
jgi:alpha-N-acetylglucosaminidase